MKAVAALRLVEPTALETADAMPGDDIIADANVVMDRAFTVTATPEVVWPWLVQLGKQRAGWYFPRPVERFIPLRRRGARQIDPRWQSLAAGDVVPDYGGPNESFTVASITPPSSLVYYSRRGHLDLTWSIRLTGLDDARTRVQLRLRLGPVKRAWLARSAGDLFDLLTIAGMAAGLKERLNERLREH